MDYQNLIDFLLENANPSIKLRVKKEILGSITLEEEANLIAKIAEEPIYKLIAACQKENGWLGNGFHGPNKDAGPYENQEVGVKYLAEKAVGRDNIVLKHAMDAFVTTELTDLCYRTKGKYYDEFRYAANGQNLIRCACIARAGYDDIIDIKPQIQLVLDSFKRVLEVDSILDITRIKKVSCKEKRVFNDYEKWPCYYHLDILAHTSSWKTDENIKMLAEAVKKLMRIDRPECQVGGDSWVGYVLGTVGCLKEGYTLGYDKDGIHYTYLDRLEWLCRCGLAPYIPELQAEVEILANAIDENGICRATVDENQLRGISTYGGQQLEMDWKTDTKKLCDITFRVLLIMFYSKKRRLIMKLPKYVRIQGREIAWKTKKPVGVFILNWRRIRDNIYSPEDVKLYDETHQWFLDNLPQPPFYGDNNDNPQGAITYFKTENSDVMLEKIQPLIDLLDKYDIPYDIVYTNYVGKIIYEDEYQVGVIDP